jgi:hypothetical protein
MPDEITQLLIDRDAVLTSGDEVAIRAYYKKYGIVAPADPVVFWGAFHKARCEWRGCPPDLRAESAAWLAAHGMRAGITS